MLIFLPTIGIVAVLPTKDLNLSSFGFTAIAVAQAADRRRRRGRRRALGLGSWLRQLAAQQLALFGNGLGGWLGSWLGLRRQGRAHRHWLHRERQADASESLAAGSAAGRAPHCATGCGGP